MEKNLVDVIPKNKIIRLLKYNLDFRKRVITFTVVNINSYIYGFITIEKEVRWSSTENIT
jgi:hypothetical protein